MFHLLFCLGPTWILFSSGCPASFRGLPVQVSPSPATLWRWGRGNPLPHGTPDPRSPWGRHPLTEGWVCRPPLCTGRPPAPRCPRTTGSPGEPPRAPSSPTAPTGMRRGRHFSGDASRMRQHTQQVTPRPTASLSPWAHEVRPCPSPWARRGRLRVPGHPVPPA